MEVDLIAGAFEVYKVPRVISPSFPQLPFPFLHPLLLPASPAAQVRIPLEHLATLAGFYYSAPPKPTLPSNIRLSPARDSHITNPPHSQSLGFR
ncbi:hypothetical protein AB1N83_009515 [Pleurotus pulmonarius]